MELAVLVALRCYRYPDAPGELPLKDGAHDHPIDALRYFFVNEAVRESIRVKRY